MRSNSTPSALLFAALLPVVGCDEPRYPITGDVIGLDGTGLVLLHDGEPLPIGANGTFEVPGSFASGTEYVITVGTQPSQPAQVCTVMNGTGTVRRAVSDITVACETTPIALASTTPADQATLVPTDVAPTLTFSVAVDPATIPGHVTLTRGASNVPVMVEATSDTTVSVTPTDRLALLTRYTLSAVPGILGIYDEPLGPSTSISFTTRDGAWHPQVPVQSGVTNPSEPHIVRLSDGSMLATWLQYDLGIANLWANRYVPGSGWGTSEQIENIDPGSVGETRLVADRLGHAYVVWSQPNGARVDIYGNRYTIGSGWGSVATVSTCGVGAGNYYPSIGVDDAGNVLVVWSSVIAGDYSVWAQTYDATGSMGTPTRIESLTGNASYPKVAVDAGGDACVVYVNADSLAGTADLWASRFDGTNWAAPESLESATESVSEYSIAADGQGHVFIAWSQSVSASAMSVFARRFDSANGWGAPATLDTTSNSSAYYPEVAADASGNAIVLWGQYAGSSLVESSSYYTPTGGWQAKIPMPGNTSSRAIFDASGNAFSVWNAEVGTSNRVIRSSRFTAADGWTNPTLVTPAANPYAEDPAVALDAYGGAIAIWTEYDAANARTDIQSARFDDLP